MIAIEFSTASYPELRERGAGLTAAAFPLTAWDDTRQTSKLEFERARRDGDMLREDLLHAKPARRPVGRSAAARPGAGAEQYVPSVESRPAGNGMNIRTPKPFGERCKVTGGGRRAWKWAGTSLNAVLFLIVVLAPALPARAQKTPEIELDEFVAAIPGHFPPQYVIDETGEISGFAIDVAERVAELAGVRFRYQNEGSWASAGEAVRSGRADLLVNGGITEKRKTFLDFTAPVETFRISIFVRDSTASIGGIADLPGTKVATNSTNIAVKLLKDVEDVELVLSDTPLEALYALLSGTADALVLPEPVVGGSLSTRVFVAVSERPAGP